MKTGVEIFPKREWFGGPKMKCEKYFDCFLFTHQMMELGWERLGRQKSSMKKRKKHSLGFLSNLPGEIPFYRNKLKKNALSNMPG